MNADAGEGLKSLCLRKALACAKIRVAGICGRSKREFHTRNEIWCDTASRRRRSRPASHCQRHSEVIGITDLWRGDTHATRWYSRTDQSDDPAVEPAHHISWNYGYLRGGPGEPRHVRRALNSGRRNLAMCFFACHSWGMRPDDINHGVTLRRLEMALFQAARCVSLYGEDYVFLLCRLEAAVEEASGEATPSAAPSAFSKA